MSARLRFRLWIFPALLLLISSCIKDDFVDDLIEPSLRIMNPLDSLAINGSHQVDVSYFNNIGQTESVPLTWNSDDPTIISVSTDGLLQGHQFGSAAISVEAIVDGTSYRDSMLVAVGNNTVLTDLSRSGSLISTSTYALEGDFTLSPQGNDLELALESNYFSSDALPGLYVYLSNNPNSIANAYEIGAVTIFSGAHTYTIPDQDIFDYSYVVYFCKPFNVKIGHGELTD